MAQTGKPSINPDSQADLGRSFCLGCVIVFVLFVLGVAVIAAFWLSG